MTRDSAVITIRGDYITVDFNGASLVGLDPAADPDELGCGTVARRANNSDVTREQLDAGDQANGRPS